MPQPHSLLSLAISQNARHTSSQGPPSPTFSDATNASAMNFGENGPEKIITRANLKASLHAYEELMNTSARYREALLTMSKVTAAFADAMETCAGMKGPSYEAGTRLQAASGLHHLIGNHWHLLAETLDRKFERPLRQHLDTYRTIITERSASYERALFEKSQVIRQTELGNTNKKKRNLQSFREALAVLQRQVNDLDELKVQHYQEILEHEEEVWNGVQSKVCLVVRSTMDVFDRFTAKASDPVLEPMLQAIPDPFDSYGPPPAEDSIFSILPPLSIIASAPSPSPVSKTPEERTQPLPAGVSSWLSTNGLFPEPPSDWADGSSTPPRSSPPSHHRQPHPSTSSHHPSQPDSKLRILSDDESLDVLHDDQLASLPSLNGSRTHDTDSSWEFTYGQSPYANVQQPDDITPRHSALYLPRSPEEPPDPDAELSGSPQSEEDTQVPTSI